MKKLFLRMYLLAVLTAVFAPPLASAWGATAAGDIQGEFLPLSPAYLEWLKQREERQKNQSVRNENHVPGYTESYGQEYPTGDIPNPIDYSHLEDNPPRPDDVDSPVPIYRDVPIPPKYDLRNVDGRRYVTSIKNQGSYGTCWAFASIGGMESSYLKSIGGYPVGDKDPVDLSEMHLAWYTFRNADPSKVDDYKYMKNKKFKDIMDHGGYGEYALYLYSRLDGPVAESSVPYSYTDKNFKSTPEAYERVLMLRASYPLSYTYYPDSADRTKRSQNIIKRLVMENGSMYVGYTNNWDAYHKTSSGGQSYYNAGGGSGGHAVQVIGWDDNYSRQNFKTDPGIDGAWLMKNSWGTWWGDAGCFWMSYAQKIHGITSYTTEKADDRMKAYYYDAMGRNGTWGSYNEKQVYAANIFRSTRDNEYLTDIGFFTYTNNLKYEIEICSNMGTSMPSSPLSGGTVTSGTSGTMPYAGYHTVTLDSPVQLNKGEYFSVILKTIGTGYAPVEVGYSWDDNIIIEYGSFFSYDGENWTVGGAVNANACVRAFTVADKAAVPPEIEAVTMPKGSVGDEYSVLFKAEGTKPVTWSISSGSLPSGLSLDEASGIISGIPSVAGNSTFTIRADNEAGFDTKEYTVQISQLPVIMETSFTGYLKYEFSKTLTLSSKTKTAWSISGALPDGLTLNTSSGKITGTPKKKGTYKATITAEIGSGDQITENITFTIEAKPTAAKISTSSFKAAALDTPYTHDVKVSGTEPITITVEDLPAGLTFNKKTRKITGTPEVSGTYIVKITASNVATELEGKTAEKSAKLPINGCPPAIATPPKLDDATVGKAYKSVQFYAAGSYPITWSASGLPSGMTLSKNGVLSGTPKGNPKTYNITLKSSNSGGKAQMTVPLNVLMPPLLSTKKLSAANADKKYSAKLSAKGNMPISWDITGLPEGLTFTQDKNGASATIAGTTEKAGRYTVKIAMSNSAGSSNASMALEVKGVAPKITASLAKGETGKPYTGSKIVVTGTKPLTIYHTIELKDRTKFGISSLQAIGLSFSADKETGTATITGTPTKAVKSLPITITANNSYAKKAVTKKISLTISEAKVSPNKSTAIFVEDVETAEPRDNIAQVHGLSAAHDPISFGAERSAVSLGAGEVRVLHDEGWVVAAVLPEMTVQESGMYDLDVTLSEDIEAGTKLHWLAFPQNSEGSDDDDIAEFYDMGGAEIDTVPENREISVSVWLNKEITYAPVIAVQPKE